MIPASCTWVSAFADTYNSLFGDLRAWRLEDTPDPLRRVLILTFQEPLTHGELNAIRALLRSWCEANDCVYKKSFKEGQDVKALIILKGLGPVKNERP